MILLKYFILSLSLVWNIYSQAQLINYGHVPRQPYNKYVIKDNEDSITYYLSEFSGQSSLPLIVYVQGSGNSSLFEKNSENLISPTAGHISWAYEAKDKAKLLIIEKPGINFLDQKEENIAFDKYFSLESWVARIEQVIKFVIKSEKIDTTKIMIAGHSEGGLIAASVANEMGKLVTHVAILAGEGPSQLYSLYGFAESGVFFDHPNSSGTQRIDSLKKKWAQILADPNSIEKKFWGFTFLRWSSFLKTSVIEELSNFGGSVVILQGEFDKNVSQESAKILYTSLLSKGSKVSLEMIPGADHSFNIAGNTKINGWELVVKKSIDWFLQD